MPRRVIVWRHGRTEWNLANRFQGHSDIDLDGVGREQAVAAAAVLARRDPVAIVSSDLARARDTAEALRRDCGVPLSIDPGLREAYAAQWEGLTHSEILARDAAAFHRWREDPQTRPGGSGETAAEVGERMRASVDRHIATVPDGATLVVVTHGGSARALIGEVLGWPVVSWKRLAVMGNCSWAELEVDAALGWRLHGYNNGAGGPA